MIPMMGKSMKEMLDKWSKMSNASGKVEIEVSEMFSTLAEDVITRIVFGNSYEDGKAIFELQAQQMVYATEAYQKVFIPGYRSISLNLFVTIILLCTYIIQISLQ